jgi:hypothetical protein
VARGTWKSGIAPSSAALKMGVGNYFLAVELLIIGRNKELICLKIRIFIFWNTMFVAPSWMATFTVTIQAVRPLSGTMFKVKATPLSLR